MMTRPDLHPGSRLAACCAAMLVLLFAGLAAAPAAAAAGFDATWARNGAGTCFARHYDGKHLASLPRQHLTSFSVRPLRSEADLAPGSFEVDVSFTLKGAREAYGTGAVCHHIAGGVECWVECDGGSFTMRADGSGLLLKIARLEVEGERDFSPDVAAGGVDSVVRLYAAPPSACAQE